jgi:hypothetical protein
MVDPMNALVGLQEALDSRRILLTPCALYPNIKVVFDQPHGKGRFTYANIKGGKIVALSIFAQADPLKGKPCFNVGYAVLSEMRQQGLGTDILMKGIEELSNGFKKHGAAEFYIEAVISVSNTPSNKIATKVISNSPTHCMDSHSGEPALQYVKLISLQS